MGAFLRIQFSLLFPLLIAGATGFLQPTLLQGQEPEVWRWKPKREFLLLGVGTLGTGTGLWMEARTPGLTLNDLASLQPTKVPAWDRWSLDQYSLAAKERSDWLLYSGAILPGALLLLDPTIRKAPQKPVLIMAQALSLNASLVLLTKHLTLRNRPFTYNPAVPLADKLEKDARVSFFSGHSSTMAALSFGYAGIWSSYHPDSRWKPVVWTGAAVLPAAMGLLRMQAGKHFLSDVLVGYVVGASCGYLLPKWHRIKRN